MELQVRELEDGRTIALDEEGQPHLVSLTLRKSRSAPGRIKAALVIEAEGGRELPLPFAQATVCGCPDNEPHGWTPEWRLEMN